MNGTWKTTGGAGGGAVLAVAAAAAAAEGVAWVLAHIAWILGTGLVCAVLTAVALARLIRWSERHDALVWSARAARLHAEPVTAIPRAQRPAIAPAVVNLNFYDVPAAERAAIIRTAITGGKDPS